MIAHRLAAALAVAAVLLGAVVASGGPGQNGKDSPPANDGTQPAPAEAPKPPDPAVVEAARRDFATVARVLLSPRCRNCHPVGDRPLQLDRGVPHRMNISRQSVEAGLACSTCHRDSNAPGKGAPPGAPHWGLPPRETPMIFEGRSARELCLQLGDPAATGGRDLDALVEHVTHDGLVLWAWNPGEGRTRPPVAHAEFVAAFTRWAAAGGPCPER